MSQAFEGITVLDFTQVISGPVATYQLALLGAKVIKVEPLDSGDMCRGLLDTADFGAGKLSPAFIGINLNKRSVAINLKHAGAAKLLEPLVRAADVVVENFRPGVAERLGIDYATLSELRPDMVYCSISGYGQSGPKSLFPAFDGAIQAASGMMAANGHAETGPTRTYSPIVDVSTGLMGAFAISSALHRRAVTGEGQYLDVAMLDSAVTLLNPIYNVYLATGVEPELIGNQSLTMMPTTNVFPTADGYLQVTALTDEQVGRLCAELGCADLLDDPRFTSTALRVENRDAMRGYLVEKLRAETTATWLQRLSGANVPVAPVASLPDVMTDPQLEHRSLTAKLAPHASLAAEHVESVTSGFIANTDGPAARFSAPQLGQHSVEILRECGFDAADIESMASSGLVGIGN